MRIDTTQAISFANLKYIYDYYIKDHLGSVHSVLTTEQETDKYAATMETANATVENELFYNVSSTATTVPAGFTNDPNNKMASKLNGNINTGGNKRVGPSIILKVMTGDTISISVNSWYTGAVQPAATGVTAIANDLLPILTAGIGGENGSKGGSIPTSFSGPLIGNDVATMVSTDSSAYSTARPKAFLNWMVVGEDYVAATGSTNHVGTVQIPVCNAGDTMKSIVGLNRLVCRRNGWIYIYVSNESNQDVYFDNLVINLTHGPVVEQKDYYAFGMQNPALSTQAIKYQYKNNRYTYTDKELQSQEFVDSSGLNDYDFGARFYDPVIARWNTEDPLSEKSRRQTPYNFAFNNPIRFIDPDGMDAGQYGCQSASQSIYQVGENYSPEFEPDANTTNNPQGGWVHYTDEYGNDHTDWNTQATDAESTNKWAATEGKDLKYTNVTYVGSTGYATNAYTDKNPTDGTYKLNPNGTATRLGEDAQYNTSKIDLEKRNNEESSSPEEKTAGIIGLTSDILEKGMKQGENFANSAAKTAAAGSEDAAQLVGVVNQAKALGAIFRMAGVSTTIYETYHSLGNISSGKGTWKDWGNVIIGAATGFAMMSGIGEAAVGTASIVYGIIKLF